MPSYIRHLSTIFRLPLDPKVVFTKNVTHYSIIQYAKIRKKVRQSHLFSYIYVPLSIVQTLFGLLEISSHRACLHGIISSHTLFLTIQKRFFSKLLDYVLLNCSFLFLLFRFIGFLCHIHTPAHQL